MPEKTRAARERRIDEILDAALAVFRERGFSGATTDEIARQARASKTTLYNLLGNKETLFRTLLARRMAAPEIAGVRLDPETPPETVLSRLALAVLQGVTSPDAAALVRVAIAEAARFPELRRVMAEGLRYEHLAAYLEACRARGLMAFADADQAATMFIAMAQGDWTVRALYGLLDAPAPAPAALEAHATLATKMFLTAVAA